MKKESFVKKISMYIAITLLLLISLLTAYTVSSIRVLKENEEASVFSTMQIYIKQLDSKFMAMDQCIERIVGNQSLIGQICYGNQADQYYAAMELQKSMKQDVLSNPELDYVLIADSVHKNVIAASSAGVSYRDKNEIADFIWKLKEKEVNQKKSTWDFVRIGDGKYIMKIYRGSDWSVAACSKSSTFLKDIRAESYPVGQSFLITDVDGVCVENLKKDDKKYIGETLEITDSWIHKHSDRMISLKSSYSGLHVTGLIGKSRYGNKFGKNSLLIFCIMISAIGCDMLLLRYIQLEIHRPLNHLMGTIQVIEDGDYKQRAEENYHTEELQRLTQAFNRMMDVIVHLRIRAYDEKIRLMDTRMKYFQMQLKPHFFLNALTTIYSMSYQKRDEDIRTYIDALTKTVRYMFKAGLRLVTLKEEADHLENYFAMQQLRYPNCVFWYFDMENEAKAWKVPQMLLHTFVENKYKYAVKMDGILSILIQAKICPKDGENMLYIRIEDDGVGFPEQVIQYMNYDSEDPSSEGHHVGLWNIKKTMEVLYLRKELIHLSNLETGGCLIEIWIPKAAAMHEEREIERI